MNFVEAMHAIFKSHLTHVRRKCWPKELLLTTKSTDETPTPIMFIYSEELDSSGEIPWQPSMQDIHAEDWDNTR